MSDVRSPFVYFGSRRRLAPLIWSALGDCDHYIEPFAGSLAALLNRPANHRRPKESCNDIDGFITNFWRAVRADPAGLVPYCDWPVSEIDITARHLWLVNEGRSRIARLEADPEYFDLKAAGWWVYGINSWVGSGWCHGGPWVMRDGAIVDAREDFKGTSKRYARDPGGIARQRPHLGGGQGINRVEFSGEQRRDNLLRYFDSLSERLRGVRLCCGDWSRVVGNGNGGGARGEGGGINGVYSTGVLLDPPFSGDLREKGIYRVDSPDISKDVRQWALEHGDHRRYRIILLGYAQEHASKMPKRWRMEPCPNGKRYGIKAAVNLNKEMMWFSPNCLEG